MDPSRTGTSSVADLFYSWSWLWCVAGSAPQALHLPAITGLLYCEAAHESMAAPLSVSSISEASALAFCCVIYAKLLLKMSFLSPIAPSACERVWHPSVFINFKDAFACFCHSPCWFLNLLLFSFPSSSLSGLNTSAVTCSRNSPQFPSHFCCLISLAENQSGKRPRQGNTLLHTWHWWTQNVLNTLESLYCWRTVHVHRWRNVVAMMGFALSQTIFGRV